MSAVDVRQADVADLDILVPLFEAYRNFYRLDADPEQAREFLEARFLNRESIVFLAFMESVAVGFTQLYPCFSSGAMKRIYILNDLFVTFEARRSGVGSALLKEATEYARSQGALRLVHSTEVTNTTAQAAYEKAGWMRDEVFFVYKKELAG